MWLSVSTLPPQGFIQRRSSPSKTMDPYHQLQHTLGFHSFREKSLCEPRLQLPADGLKVCTASVNVGGLGVDGVESSLALVS